VDLPASAALRVLDADYDQQAGETVIERDATLEIVNGPLKLGGGTLKLGGRIDGTVQVIPSPGSSGYLNLHSDQFPGGEIRGQLRFGPGPSVGGQSFIAVNLGGRAGGQEYDSLNVTDDALLGGNLVVDLVNGFENSILSTDVFTVLTAESLSGAFENVINGARLADVDGLGTFVVDYGPGSPFDPANVVLSDFRFIPEPTAPTILCACAALAVRRQRGRS
jgi:hypothetical protein